jgi:ABC-type glycerol-3-phosphate transport system substrate-binding protein
MIRNRKVRRTTSVLAAVSLAAATLALTACSSGSESSDSGTNAGGQTTITYWDFIDPTQDNPRSVALKKNIDNFESLNPDIKVNLEVVGSADMLARLPQAAAAGSLPDVVKIYQPWVPQMLDAGVYQSLEPYVGDIDQDDWLQPWDATVFDGEKMVMPYEYRADVLIYNQAVFDELGINVPQTWDEIVEAAKIASAAGYTGFGSGFSTSDNASIIANFFDSAMIQTGQEISDTDGNLVYDTAEGESFFDLFRSLIDADVLGASVVDGQYTTVFDGLQNGTVAMGVVGTHRVVNLQSGNSDIAWAPLPGPTSDNHATAATGWTLGIGASSDKGDAAWKFIDYMTSVEGQTIMAEGGEVPSRLSAYDDAFFADESAQIVLDFRDYMSEWGDTRTYPTNWLAISNGVAMSMQQMYLNSMSAADALQYSIDDAS